MGAATSQLSAGPTVSAFPRRTTSRGRTAVIALSDASLFRQALVDAVRLRRREQMRAESLELMGDEKDRAKSRRLLADMDELRAW